MTAALPSMFEPMSPDLAFVARVTFVTFVTFRDFAPLRRMQEIRRSHRN
jgi:hypothetical protein